MSLGSCIALYNGIESFCWHLRDEFDTIEKDGLKLTTCKQKTYASQNKRNRKTKKTFDHEGEDTGCTRATVEKLRLADLLFAALLAKQ